MTNATGPARFNHVAMSVPADLLDERGRADITRFYGEVFGWEEHPTMTLDRQRLVMGVHQFDQFVFLIAEPEPMTTARLDHFGLAADSMDQFLATLDLARTAAESDDRVEFIEHEIEDHGVLQLHNFYVKFLLPLWVEVQFFELPSS